MTLSKNPDDIKNMFNRIASKYDFNNNIISLGFHKLVKKAAVKHLTIKNGMHVLDECTGSGDVAYYLYEINNEINVTGIDFSDKMLQIANKKYPEITFLEYDCTKLPYDNESFDIITMSFGLRNIENYKLAMKESFRVLKPGGELMHLDFGGKNAFSKGFDFFAKIIIKIFFCENLSYNYLIESKRVFFTPEELIKEFEEEGFVLKKRQDYLMGIISMQIFEKKKLVG